jgi:hypothetical protein
MKVIARVFLFLFIAFLSMPVIVTVIKKSSNTSMFFNMSEEEHVKKEIKDFAYFNVYSPPFLVETIIITVSKYFKIVSKYDQILRIIFSPPPNIA